MTTEPNWLSKKALLLLHEESLAEFGGARGLRDEGLLDSALARHQNGYVYKSGAALAELADCYGFGIARTMPSQTGTNGPLSCPLACS